jgi:hypothetical protein
MSPEEITRQRAIRRAEREARPLIDRPSVLVCHQKHGDIYYNAPDDAALCKAALSILKERLEDGYWYNDPADELPANPNMTDEQIDALPAGRIRDTARQEMTNYHVAVQEQGDAISMWKDIHRAIEENNGKLAWRILRDRRDYEYERCSIEQLQEVEDE